MANLNPDRKRTHVVIDNIDACGREGVYEGSYEDCLQFLQEQGDADIIGLYEIIPNYFVH